MLTGDLALSHDQVHIWRAALDVPASHLHDLGRLLCEDEVCRASRFRFERDRRRFVAARGTLRILLGRYLALDPAEVRFQYGAYGKPSLAAHTSAVDLRFNVTHSEDLALYAFACGREVGVDLERIRPVPEMEQIAEGFFSARERAALKSLEPGQRLDAFYACWTRKEAYIKARGEGLALPLDRFDVSLAPGEPARLLDVRRLNSHRRQTTDRRELERWSLHALAPAPGYAAALAIEGACSALDCRQVPTSTRMAEARLVSASNYGP